MANVIEALIDHLKVLIVFLDFLGLWDGLRSIGIVLLPRANAKICVFCIEASTADGVHMVELHITLYRAILPSVSHI